MHTHYGDGCNEEENYSTATNTTLLQQQQQKPLLSVATPSPQLSSTQQQQHQPHYGSCYGQRNENESVMILQSDSDNESDTMNLDDDDHDHLSLPPPPPPKSTKLSSYHCVPVPLFVVGSVPHSVFVATTIGIACGVSAYIYNEILQYGLTTIWKTWSQQLLMYLQHQPSPDGTTTTTDFATTTLPAWTVLWIPMVALVLSVGLGYTVRYVGEPGDLASTIQCVHLHGWIELNHALPMALASLFSIIAGASVGPEAALVAICATLAGFISQSIFGINPKTQRNLVRKHTLMGVRHIDRIAGILHDSKHLRLIKIRTY